MEAKLKEVCQEWGLAKDAAFHAKCLQVYEANLHHTTLIMTGAPSSGRTTASTVLRHALAHVLGAQHLEQRLTPRVLCAGDMFGRASGAGVWLDGLFTSLWRRANAQPNPESPAPGAKRPSLDVGAAAKTYHWLVCDGDVDANFMRHVLSCLDERKVLPGPAPRGPP